MPQTTLDKAASQPRPRRQRTPHVLAHGDLRLLLLGLLQSRPRHGYELIQLISGIFRGHYQPSAGALYPTLSQLQADGLVSSRRDGVRRLHELTAQGRAWIDANAEAIVQARLRTEHSARVLLKVGVPPPVRDGMEALKQALSRHEGQWDSARTTAVAAILRRAATDISTMDPTP
ncbi:MULTISPECIES: PadR family transcriptional regulator [unclassified Luteimonas]